MSPAAELGIQVENLSRRFGQKVIFDSHCFQFNGPGLIGITGINGRGKSTLLKILGGLTRPDSGHIHYHSKGQLQDPELLSTYSFLSGPYMDLPEHLRLKELLELHKKLMGSRYRSSSEAELLAMAGLSADLNQFLHAFSSGMKQRIRLLLAFLTEVPFWYLDEPGSNLDQAGFEFYSVNIRREKNIRLILVASNQPESELLDAKETYEL